MSAHSKIIDASDVSENAFEKDEDVRLAGPLASLAWFAVAFLLVLAPHGFKNDGAYAAAAAAGIAGCLIAGVELASSWSPLAQRILRLAPALLTLAVIIDVALVFSF